VSKLPSFYNIPDQAMQKKIPLPTSYSSTVFIFRLIFESLEVVESASHGIKALVEFDSLIGEF